MKTYFVRHTSALDIDEPTLEKLWNNDYFGIHYPHDNHNKSGGDDSSSIDPNDYSGVSKSVINRLNKIGEKGGYVFAVYRGIDGGKIGYVEPGTNVEILQGSWGDKNGMPGKKAKLKVLKLKKCKTLSAIKSISLTSVQPRQGTLCHWKKVGSRIEDMVQGKVNKEVGSLTPDLQEVMCMEFLRTDRAQDLGLPKIDYTLTPVGRTLKDLDIIGSTTANVPIGAQVTFHSFNENSNKFKKLDKYLKQGCKTIYFCRCEKMQVKHGHIVFPIIDVFEEFCLKSTIGESWYNMVTNP